MKTRIALPPGVELNLDDPGQQRWALHDAMDEMERHPRPKRDAPRRSRWWWFWRAFGYVIFSPARLFWAWYHRARYLELPSGELGAWTYRYPSAKRFEELLRSGWRWPRRLKPVRDCLYWLLIRDYCICPHCGFTDYGEEYTIYAEREGERDVTVDLFEWVDGGGLDYWGEAEDAHGWMWCWRCGYCSWETV